MSAKTAPSNDYRARGLGRIVAVIMGLIAIVLMLAIALWIAPQYFTALINAIF